MDFVQLLHDARLGDAAALARLLDRWRPVLTLQARLLLRNRAADSAQLAQLVQAALAHARRDLPIFRGTTQRQWVQQLCAALAARVAVAHGAWNPGTAEVPDEPPGSWSTIDCEDLHREVDCEQELALATAIEALPGPMREVLLRRALEQQSFEQIARALACPPASVRILWINVLRTLREALAR